MKTRRDGTRPLIFRSILLAAAVSAISFIAIPIFGDSSAALTSARAATTATGSSKYVGPGGCAATSCHGSVKPRADTRIFQNEYSIWVVQDKHSRAYTALTSPIGERIGRILGIGKSEEAPKCLACHALDVPAEARAKTFDPSVGVARTAHHARLDARAIRGRGNV